jgi:SAM-dependent methyltransferase
MTHLSPSITESIRKGTLICPLCHSELLCSNEGIFCKNQQCTHSEDPIPLIENRIPILVNFDKTILSRETLLATGGESLIPRTGNRYDKLKSIFWGSGKKTKRNLEAFMASLPRHESRKATILIVGGGAVGNGASRMYEEKNVDILSFDIYASANTDFVADGHQIPVASGSVDAVWIQAVLEHVMYPQQIASEIYRVLATNGIVYAETPFLQHVHEGAYDFTRFTESGHRLLFKNFKTIDSGFLTGIGTVLLWNIRYAVWGVTRSKKMAIVVSLLMGWVRLFDNLVPHNFNVDAASGVYFLGRKDPNHTFHDKDIIIHYKGFQGR